MNIAQTQITQAMTQQISKILDNQKRARPYGELFARPVDYHALGIPDYPSIVKTPMDFTKLQKKLTAKEYTNLSQFLHDASLIFKNCRLYNGDAQNGYFLEASDSQERYFVTCMQKIVLDLTFEAYQQILALGDLAVQHTTDPFTQMLEPKIEDIQLLVRKLSELPEIYLGEALKIYMDEKGIEINKLGDQELDIELSTTEGPLLCKMLMYCDSKLDELKKSKKKYKK